MKQMIMLVLLIIQFEYLSAANQHNEIIDFLKVCYSNPDNLESAIKESDYYDEDTDLSNIKYIVGIMKSAQCNYFNFQGTDLLYLYKINSNFYQYKLGLKDSSFLTFSFILDDGDFLLRMLSINFRGDLSTSKKINQIESFIADFQQNGKIDFNKKYFDCKNEEVSIRFNKSFYYMLRNNFENELILINNQNVYEPNKECYQSLTFKISKTNIIHFRYHLSFRDGKQENWKLQEIDFVE